MSDADTGARDARSLKAPVFIVGPSRSGTTLTMLIVRSHPEIHLAFETHYFDDLRPRFDDPQAGPLSEAGHRLCQDYFLAQSHRPFGHAGDPERGWLTRATLATAAASRGGTADAYFEAYVRLDARHRTPAERTEPTVLGEKTPRHAFRLDDIFARYPDARIVALVRDPRAVVASYRDWTYRGGFDFDADPGHEDALRAEQRRVARSYHPLMVAMLWRGQANAVLAAADRLGPDRVRRLRYEDLVTDPRREVTALCDWLGVAFDPAMLDVPMSNSSVEVADGSTGISPLASERWRRRLSDAEIAAVESVTSSTMAAAGYERVGGDTSLWSRAHPWATLPVAGVRAVAVNRDRIGNPVLAVARRLRALR